MQMISMNITRPIVALLCASAAFFAYSPTALAQGKGDDVVTEMNAAFKSSDKKRLTALLPQARGHALEPYAAYWELKARLGEASAAEVQSFMAQYAGTYQEDRLRNDWLLLLGQRRDWANFADLHPAYRMQDDREVRCYAILVQHLKKPSETTQAMVDEVRRNWHGLRDTDDGCNLAADRMIDAKKLKADDAWRKARIAIDSNRPGAASKAVQIVSPEASGDVAALNASPARYLGVRTAASGNTRRELVVLALVKMANSDPDAAANALEGKWNDVLTLEEKSWAWGVIGKQAALKLSDNANGYYAKAKNEHLNDDLLGWKVRAALRTAPAAKGWPVVLAAVNAMGDDERKDPTWAYWKARALRALYPNTAVAAALAPAVAASGAHAATPAAPNLRPELQEAQSLLEAIASPRGFYEILATEELGRKITAPERPSPLTAEEKETARLNPGLNRALYAVAIGLRAEGVREWNYSTNLHTRGGMTERELLAAAQFACDKEVWDRCINTSERTKEGFDHEQRFPMPFKDAVVKRSRAIGLDPAYVYGLIRQESRFIMDARSGVGASGLMQVMPATARWTAKKIGMDGFTADQINNRDTNIAIGTGYLKLVLDDFSGSMPMAAAAYNAGPSRPRAWRNGPVMEAAVWAENIPFAETRDYVKKVLANTTVYAAVITGQPQSMKARLGSIGPREGAAPEPNKDLP
jgi:soluble lytic murein transglycosylase